MGSVVNVMEDDQLYVQHILIELIGGVMVVGWLQALHTSQSIRGVEFHARLPTCAPADRQCHEDVRTVFAYCKSIM